MTTETRELYASSSGDRWYLACQPEAQRVFVKHVANEPSGGQVTHVEVAAFLAQGGHSPEQQALMRLIGTLTAGRSDWDGGSQPLPHPAASNTNTQEDAFHLPPD